MLSDIQVKNAHKHEKTKLGKAFKLADDKGLFLLVRPDKALKDWSKLWRVKFRIDGKEKLLSLGTYPEISLSQARLMRDKAREQIALGTDPAQQKKAAKQERLENQANTFQLIADEWLVKKCRDNSGRPQAYLAKDFYPFIGNTPIKDLKPKDILQCARRLEGRGAIESAHRALRTAGQVFRYAVALDKCERDITQDLKGALPVSEKKHYAAITEPGAFGRLLADIDDFKGLFITHYALKLAPLLFQRPGELRAAKWQDFDLNAKEWRYRVPKTKIQHIVPLSNQALALIREVRALTGGGTWLFPSLRNPKNNIVGGHMAESTLNSALRTMGYSKEQMTSHGFRAAARTILDEVLKFPPHLIEHQLAHAVRDVNGRAYNRTAHLPERREMMQKWADYCDALKALNS